MLRLCAFGVVALLALPLHAGQTEERALALINAARGKAGCVALSEDPRLTAAALGHAKDMAEQDYFDHKGRDGSNFATRARRAGFGMRAGAENIAAGHQEPEAVVAQWLDSEGHRKNMLNCGYRTTGIAMFYQADDKPFAGNRAALRAYWVQVFSK